MIYEQWQFLSPSLTQSPLAEAARRGPRPYCTAHLNITTLTSVQSQCLDMEYQGIST